MWKKFFLVVLTTTISITLLFVLSLGVVTTKPFYIAGIGLAVLIPVMGISLATSSNYKR